MFFCPNAKKVSKAYYFNHSSEILFKKIHYDECLLHVLLNYFIFGAVVSKTPFF